MNKVKSHRIIALILAVIAVVLLAAGIYVMTRPISYGLNYYHTSFYEGDDFSGSMTFYPDNTMVVRNTTFVEETKFFYYYKNGYVFFSIAETQEEFEQEVAAINEDFEGAVNTPFYASRANAFRLSSEGPDGYKSVYVCQMPIMIVVVLGAIGLTLISFVIASVIRRKKKNEA